MGHKVSPISLRITVSKDWRAKWFSEKKFAEFLTEDFKIRDIILKKWAKKGIAEININRDVNLIKVTAKTSKPGLIIGRGGAGIDEMKRELEKTINGKVEISIEEVKNADIHAALIAEGIATALEKKISFRRVMKQFLERIKKAGAKGAKISVSGRLNGVEMARREWVSFGKIPLQTLRADIDYATGRSYTTYGVIGVKVWIYRGEKF
ncbi:30S ribosomal protein S3 [bacterium CG_4_10_14_0_2_um_filter_33_32]|nr:MAG: 30S ribosomal protein S3 [bacterium CG2_30_33_46]PIR67365.1 MAG: 30S ribosomal protein S3 [bacterium CG10_big_fil_rev_8_21_14_0_10_33_18]PIU76752.1 MAG: 30S ribosomal protein S3 [bacterium CG06_land_8_20_14_3_00_33_50]PIW81302.1 MAG: 30S ribosomal protein S3 [bacterium CG_4_8_14_3_um_filter_33_28]PIY85709.1 MAG: 30S ribosomal protein S3 [bacterium CG_4_10_14_0_8_um_filter_33_57]PIZ86588.1 MAG: 30S ribosomal protein S3 [bacterium CG_4_10_14_0_2_um_filter_33_32]PJA72117.1 MAG: 30S ribos